MAVEIGVYGKALADGRAARQCGLVSRLSGPGDHFALTPAPALGKTQDLTNAMWKACSNAPSTFNIRN